MKYIHYTITKSVKYQPFLKAAYVCRNFSTIYDKYQGIDNSARIIFNKYIGEITSIIKLGNHRNYNYKVKSFDNDYVIKIFNVDARPFPNTEPFVNSKLQGLTRINKCIISDKYINDFGERLEFMIFKYVEGKTLLHEITNSEVSNFRLKIITDQVYNFIMTCNKIKLLNFGDLDQGGKGKYNTWQDFLSNYLEFIYSDIQDLEFDKRDLLRTFYIDLSNFLHKEAYYFKSIEQGSLVSYDINLSNFILTSNDEVVSIDTESFISGDKLLPFGVWRSNTYGTKLYDYFFENLKLQSEFEYRAISFYSALKALSILIYIAKYNKGDIKIIKPYGNDVHNFLSIMELDIYKMKGEKNKTVDKYNFDHCLNIDQIEILGQDRGLDPVEHPD